MSPMLHRDNLVKVGLSEKEATVYEALLATPTATAGQLLYKAPGIKRPNLYALLDALKEKGLVLETSEKGKKVFRAESPQRLLQFVEKQERESRAAKLGLESALPALLSQFNLASGKPNVQYFEGPEGMEKVVFDSLLAKDGILSYVDHEAVQKYFQPFNARYMKARKVRGVRKKIITADTESIRKAVREEIDPAFTEVRVVDLPGSAFASVMQIYNDKVTYQTLESEMLIGVIITDKRIAAMHKALFEHTWRGAEQIKDERSNIKNTEQRS